MTSGTPRAEETISIAIPGQSVAYGDLLKVLAEPSLVGREAADITRLVTDEMEDATGVDPLYLATSLTPDELSDTRHTHLLSLAAAGAGAGILMKLYGIKPNHVRGHSVAGIAAATLGGYLAVRQAAQLLQERGEEMHRLTEERPTTMAVTDIPAVRLEAICQKFKGVWPANFNSPLQSTFAGWVEAVNSVRDEIKKEGYRATLLRNYRAGAAHTELVKRLRLKLIELTAGISFGDERRTFLPYSKNTDGTITREPLEVKADIVAADQPVRWREGTDILLRTREPLCQIEIGPGSRRPLTTMFYEHELPPGARAIHIADILPLQKG